MPKRTLTVITHDGSRPAAAVQEETVEMNELAAAANMDVLATHTVKIRHPRPATYIGAGALEKIRQTAAQCNIETIVFNCELTVTQSGNLEKETGRLGIDRTELILSIFSRRATSHEGKLQVELARCRRQLGRLSGLWTHLERQRGGIGLRGGPGEKQMELDRRLLAGKIRRLEEHINKIADRNRLARKRRRKNGFLNIALVGYTNAGKSSLFNLLAGESRPARDRLFDTLDSTARRVRGDNGIPFILSDTVGFIRHLPHELIAGFRATLQDTADSDALIIVVDRARDDWRERLDFVDVVLQQLGAGDKRRIIVLNKIDQINLSGKIVHSKCGRITTVFLSCRTQDGIPLLQQALNKTLAVGNDDIASA